jgi:hypothetical protein
MFAYHSNQPFEITPVLLYEEALNDETNQANQSKTVPNIFETKNNMAKYIPLKKTSILHSHVYSHTYARIGPSRHFLGTKSCVVPEKGLDEASDLGEENSLGEASRLCQASGLGQISSLGQPSTLGEASVFVQPNNLVEASCLGEGSGLGEASGFGEASCLGEASGLYQASVWVKQGTVIDSEMNCTISVEVEGCV